MRLIDADALNKRLSEMEAEISEDDCMPGDAFSDGIISAILDIKKCIQNQENYAEDIGNKVFLTKAEAEEKLKELRGEENGSME